MIRQEVGSRSWNRRRQARDEVERFEDHGPRSVLPVSAQAVDDAACAPISFASVPAHGAVDVWRQSPIEIDFADLMNPATLAHPVTGQSSFIRVHFDPDGNLQTASDQVPIAGSFSVTLDQNRIATHVRFHALGGLPASGVQREPGRVVVLLSPQIQDLGGNLLANPGSTSFTTEAR